MIQKAQLIDLYSDEGLAPSFGYVLEGITPHTCCFRDLDTIFVFDRKTSDGTIHFELVVNGKSEFIALPAEQGERIIAAVDIPEVKTVRIIPE